MQENMGSSAPAGHPTAEGSANNKSHPRPASIGSGGTEVLAGMDHVLTSSYHTSSGGGHESTADKGSPSSVPDPVNINRGYRDNSQGIFPTGDPGKSRQRLGNRPTGPTKGR